MATFLGNLQNFDHKVQEWSIFLSRLEQFIKLNDIKGDRKSAVLLTHLSDESYRLAHDLVHPKKLNSLEYSELVDAFNLHFKPVRSTFAEKAKFYEAVRAPGESVEEWAARLRGLAVYGGFDDALDTVLRDRFVLGFDVGPERDRLFEQNTSELTFAKAVEVAKQAASARQARAKVAAAPAVVKEEPVYRMSGARGGGRGGGGGGAGAGAGAPSRAGGSGRRCTVCGLLNHEANKCRFKNYRCQKCGNKGHLKKVCGHKSVYNINANPDSDGEHSECEECQLFNMRENFTLQLLAKFKDKLHAIKEKAQEEGDEKKEEEAKDDDNLNTDDWLGHTLRFEDKGAVLAKDASTKGDDWFDIYDPRNPINKRKREAEAKSSKKSKK